MPRYVIKRGGIHQRFFDSRKKIRVLGGGFGNGKTAAACILGLRLAMDYPGSNGLIARETYPKLNDTIRKEFYKWCPAEAVARWPTKDDNTLVMKNGSVVNFRYIAQRGKQTADGFSTSNLLSATYDWVIVDQMEDPGIQHKDFLDLLGRLRGSASYKGSDPTMPMTGPRWFIGLCNPTANWVYKKLVKPYHRYLATGLVEDDLISDPHTKEPMIEVIEGSTYENAHNLDADFIQMMESTYKGQMKARFLMGEWAAYEGLVYPSFDAKTHMMPKREMLRILHDLAESSDGVENVEGFDLGIVSPSCHLLGFTDHMGRLFIMDGYHGVMPSLSDIAANIHTRRMLYANLIDFTAPMWSDPAIFRRVMVNGTGKATDTVAKILREQHEIEVKAGQNDITSGILKITEYLATHEGMGLKPGTDGPLIYFSDELTFIEDEMVSYFWKSDSDGNRLDIPKDGNDHALDALKYLVSRLPEASKLLFRKPVITPEYLKWHEAM